MAKNKWLNWLLPLLLLLVIITATAIGAVSISLEDMYNALLHKFQGQKAASVYEGVFLYLRTPRVLLCVITGAALAVSGVLMQGLFRNPIVEPGMVGTSAGAAFGASVVFVLAASWEASAKIYASLTIVPLFAFAGAILSTLLVYRLAGNTKSVSLVHLLLIGISVNAVALSGTGFMSYTARDPQARSITFWNLGTFTGASWTQVAITGSIVGLSLIFCRRYAAPLNLLLLGESEAAYLGVSVSKLKRQLLIVNTLLVAITTAFVGVISFVGLIVPHILRSLIGSDHRRLIPYSAMAGAIVVVLADLLARMLLAPAEIPIGIITSLVGAPLFIVLLKRSSFLLKNNQS
ncbi:MULTISPECIES: FecCD family ABC transporter permease [unclassified Paraflavitalea]|uniref:FecCD family ABC transporter permease n=1 Tax=unclassified Paraflavitalea TaxID=2798305 RepID=UPI003D3544C4